MSTALLAMRALGWSVLLSLWQGAVIALLFALLLRVARGTSPVLRRGAALCGQLVMVTLLFGSAVALFELWRPVAETALPRSLPRLTGESSAVALASVLVSARPALVALLRYADEAALWMSAVWLGGVLLTLSILFVRYRVARRIVAASHGRDDLLPRVQRLAARLGVSAPVVTVQAPLWTPGVLGWLRPVLVLPEYADRLLSPDQLDAVLAHELAHVRRGDHALHLLESVIGCLFFYHPGVWYLNRAGRRAREEACDDLAVSVCGSALVYARALERLESARSWSPRSLAAAVALDDGELLSRVRRLVVPASKGPTFKRFTVTIGFAAAVGLLLALSVPAAVAPAVPVARLQNRLMRIHAEDPAGRFTVTMIGVHVLGATMDGALVSPEQLRQEGDRLRFLRSDGSVDFTLRLRADGFEWLPRKPQGPPD